MEHIYQSINQFANLDSNDEILKNIINEEISSFLSRLELGLEDDDLDICIVTSSNIYWGDDFKNKKTFEKVWREEYEDDYVIVSEEEEIFSLQQFLDYINK